MTFRPDEICEDARVAGFAGHAVMPFKRYSRSGDLFNPGCHDYQQGRCENCGQMVYSERPPGSPPKKFHPWRLLQFVIHEEDTVDDLLAALY
jgi:hypothetical protein